MREIEVVLTLHDMIGIFIAEREAEPYRLALRRNHVDAGDFRLFTAIEGEIGEGEIAAGWSDGASVALVKPLRLDARISRLGFAAIQSEIEHPDRIGFGARLRLSLLVHLVACCSAAKMSETGAGDEAMGAVRVING